MSTLPLRAIRLRALALGALGALGSMLLASCASLSPEARVRAGLLDAGLSPRMAECMARRMVDRLSISQLRRLQSLASLRKSGKGGMSIDQLLNKLRALDDPEIFAVTSKSALTCAIKL